MRKVIIIILVLTLVSVCFGDIFTSHLKPTSDNTLDVGTSSLFWRHIYGVDGTFSGTITASEFDFSGSDITTTGTITAGEFDFSGSDITITGTITAGILTDGTFTVTGGVISAGTWQGDTLTVPYGGTGAITLTDGGLLVGSGTSAITALSVLADGSIIVGDGATDPVALAAFTSSTGDLKHEAGGLEFDASAVVDSDFIVGTGAGSMGLESGNTARTSLGLGTGDSLTFTGQTITGNSVFGLNSSVFQPTTDSTTFFQVFDADGGTPVFNVDTTNEQVTIGQTSATYPFLINSTDGSDQIGIYHDNFNAYFKTTDGTFIWMTDEGTNTNTFIQVKGKGTGRGFLQLYDQDDAEYMQFGINSGYGDLWVAGSAPVALRLQEGADIPVLIFSSADEGETQELKIYGWRTGDSRKILEIGVGVDADDTASFDGVSNYYFDGNVGIGTTSPAFAESIGKGLHVFSETANKSAVIKVEIGNGGSAGYRAILVLDNALTGGRQYEIASTSEGDGVFGAGKLGILDRTAGDSAVILTIDSSGITAPGYNLVAWENEIVFYENDAVTY